MKVIQKTLLTPNAPPSRAAYETIVAPGGILSLSGALPNFFFAHTYPYTHLNSDGSPLPYNTGDHFVVYAHQSPATTAALLDLVNLSPTLPVQLKTVNPCARAPFASKVTLQQVHYRSMRL